MLQARADRGRSRCGARHAACLGAEASRQNAVPLGESGEQVGVCAVRVREVPPGANAGAAKSRGLQAGLDGQMVIEGLIGRYSA